MKQPLSTWIIESTWNKMYQNKHSLLTTTREGCSDASPIQPDLDDLRDAHGHALDAPIGRRRRERNALRAKEFLARVDPGISLNLADSGRPYNVESQHETAVAAIFAEPLPNVTEHDIPFGTCLPSPEDDRMSELPQTLVDAIDAGSSEIGRRDATVAYFLRNSRSVSTRDSYRWAWKRALRTCQSIDRCPLPMDEATAATVVIDAVNDGLVFGSIRTLATVISVAHGIAKQPDPTATDAFRSVMRGIARVLGDRPDRKIALEPDELRLIRDACVDDSNRVRGVRDWALISYGFGGAFRRSEVVASNVVDLAFLEGEMRVYLDRSKTDQFGRGAYISIQPAKDPRVCPIAAMRAWLQVSPGPGPIFRKVSKHGTVCARRLAACSVSYIVKRFGIVLDLPEDRLGAHSLRAGIITALLEAGVSETLTMKHSRHKSPDTLHKYYRPRRPTVNYTEMAGL